MRILLALCLLLLPIVAHAQSVTETGPAGYASRNGWDALNNVWNPGTLVSGTDYTMQDVTGATTLTAGTTFSWSFPLTASYSTVRAYPDILFGDSPWGRGQSDPTDVFPIEVSNLTAATLNYNLTWGGTASGYDVSYDIWFTSAPGGGTSTITNEVMVWMHQGGLSPYGQNVGTYTDGAFVAPIYHSGTYTALIANADSPAGSINLAHVVAVLEGLNIIKPTEYLASVSLGAEVVQGADSLTINSASMAMTSGGVTSTITGTGVTTAPVALPVVPPVAAAVDTVVLTLAEDAYEGDADFVLSIDGHAVTTPQAVTAIHGTGGTEVFSYGGTFGAGPHTLGVGFVNDAYGGSAAKDRNLYIQGVALNGASVFAGTKAQDSNGAASFAVTTAN